MGIPVTYTLELPTAEEITTPTPHPLDPLTAEEITRASSLVKNHEKFTADQRFVMIELFEPTKDAVRVFEQERGPWQREAFIILRDRKDRETIEVVVDLTGDRILRYEAVPAAQAQMTVEEMLGCEEIIRADLRFQEAVKKRGITDFSTAIVDKWASGYTKPEDDPARRRIARPIIFIQDSADTNGYAKPIENLVITVDLDTMEIVEVQDTGVVPVPPQQGRYTADGITKEDNSPHFEKVREPMKPISIIQPEGPSFTMDGHGIKWANWKLRVGYTPREGLVLHQIQYNDRGAYRPVLYRASLSEMYVPYGDPGETHWNKNVFDEGEYGLGGLANSLVLGCDCVGDITYLDAYVSNDDGEPTKIANAVCIHEEDAGIGWKHTDYRTGRGEVRRNRRLVISIFTTVGNYDYGFYWYLYLDGSIEFESKLTGIISTGAVAEGEKPKYGKIVAPGLYGPNHQHFFAMRFDMTVDGEKNSIYELQAEVAPEEENVWGSAWYEAKTLLKSELEAQRNADPLRGRRWVITNPEKTNISGGEPGYKLQLGGDLTLPLAQPGSQQYERGGFARKHLWATVFDRDERYAAGEYIAQNPGNDGLPKYAASDRNLVASDLVLWPILSAHHVVRPEDWPVMPVATVGFHLKPSGFFDGNPMLDLPAEKAAACH